MRNELLPPYLSVQNLQKFFTEKLISLVLSLLFQIPNGEHVREKVFDLN